MIRKFAIASLISVSMALSGCANLTPGSVSSVTTSLLQEVEQVVAVTCSAIPEAAAVISLLNAGVAGTAAALGLAFCNSFAAAQPKPTPVPASMRLKARALGLSASPQRYCAGNICGWH